MTITVTPGWWLLPLAATIAAIWWFCKQDYSGDYNFNAVFTAPVAGMVICASWMLYSSIGWALS